MNSLLASDLIGVVGTIDPDAYSASTVVTGWISAADFQSYLAIVQAGTLGSSATLDAKLQQASDAAGTGAKDITGKAITQLTQAGTDSDKIALINLDPDELDVTNGFTHFRLSITIATAASDAGGLVLGLNAAYGPARLRDLAAVDEIVA